MLKRCVVLLSGGLDSATTAAIAREEGFEVFALTLAYGQRHELELRSAALVADHLKLKSHRIAEIPVGLFGGSALTDDIEVPKDRDESQRSGEIPVTYVPARNTVFLSLALAYAESLGAWDIFCGVNAVDYSGYPDCRPEFIAAFQTMARLATKFGVEGAQITIRAPLINRTKPDIIRMGLALGVDYSVTHSCYDPVSDRPCGRCDSCLIRVQAFRDIGLEDPALG